jgi:hypothetical protein
VITVHFLYAYPFIYLITSLKYSVILKGESFFADEFLHLDVPGNRLNHKIILWTFVTTFNSLYRSYINCRFSYLLASMTGYGLDGRSSISARGKRLSLSRSVQTVCGASAFYPVGTAGSFLGGKAAGREADNSLPCSAEVNCAGAILPLPIRLHSVVFN